jgi:hypothetical protein
MAAVSAAFLLVGGAGAATAETSQAQVAAGSWISCVKKIDSGKPGIWQWVIVENQCAWTYNVKIVWDNVPDSECEDLKPGHRMRDTVSIIGTYRGVQIC